MTAVSTALTTEARRVERVALRHAARYGLCHDVVELRTVARALRSQAAAIEFHDQALAAPARERALILRGLRCR